MNNIMRATIEVPCGVLKAILNNLKRNVFINPMCAIAPFAEITIDMESNVIIGKKLRVRSGAHIRVRKNAKLIIGNNTFINHNCIITCRDRIEIGSNVQFSPNVMIYDHDHDFRTEGGIKTMKYKTSPIFIGNNVWIGSNSVILRGAKIGDDVVIGAGSVIKGEIPPGAVLIQKRVSEIK